METVEKELNGKVALVTGAGRGIGRAIALKLGEMGATVLVNYNGSADRARETAEQITALGGSAETVCCNVADYQACGKMVEEIIGKYKRVDILVNNAGIAQDNLIMRMSEEEYDSVLNTNLKGAFNTIRHLSRFFLKQRSGKIINISSVSGVLGNAVAPGFVDTEMTKAMPEKTREAAIGMIPMGRMGLPEEIAETVGFLAGNGANYITGQVICVDGGMAI